MEKKTRKYDFLEYSSYGHMAMNQFYIEDLSIVKGMYSSLKWFHAVNSSARLDDVVAQIYQTQMKNIAIETDVRLRTHRLVLAHDADEESTLTLSDLIASLCLSLSSELLQVVKLDVKEVGCWPLLLKELRLLPEDVRRKIWFNADVVAGPATSSERVLSLEDCASFLADFAQEECGLSLGWVTNPMSTLPYDQKNIDDMCELLERLKITTTTKGHRRPRLITFAVRHSLVTPSVEAKALMSKLLEFCGASNVAEVSFLTFWRGRNETISDVAAVLEEFPCSTVDLE